MKFLDEKGAREAIRSLVRDTDKACLAVAFWGRDAVESLGLDRPGLDLTIICNLDSGACNPDEIRKAIDVAGADRVLADPRLHAKVYWTPDGAVLGSSNASTNGLAVEEGMGGWAEANMLIEDPDILAEIGSWFETRRASAYVVGDDDLARAEVIWKSRSSAAPSGSRLTTDLVTAFRQAPDHPVWRRVRAAIWTGKIDAQGTKELEAAQDANSALENWECFQGWNKELKAGDWLLDVDLSGPHATFGGICRVPAPKIETPSLTFVRKANAVSLPGFAGLKLSKEDQKALEAVAPALLARTRSTEGTLVSLARIVAAIDKRAAAEADKAVEAAFERVLLDAHAEARELHYHPTRFLELVKRLGGRGAARQLLKPGPPPSGLTRLMLENRIDLSIEDTVLRPEWSELFDPEELDVARRRLGR